MFFHVLHIFTIKLYLVEHKHFFWILFVFRNLNLQNFIVYFEKIKKLRVWKKIVENC